MESHSQRLHQFAHHRYRRPGCTRAQKQTAATHRAVDGRWLPTSRSEASVTAVSDFGERTVTVPVEPLGMVGMIELILPIPFLFATAIGGAIGGVLRASQKKFKRWPWQICEGILVAVVIVAALSAGFQFGSLSGGMVGKAVGVFAVAAVAAIPGPHCWTNSQSKSQAREKTGMHQAGGKGKTHNVRNPSAWNDCLSVNPRSPNQHRIDRLTVFLRLFT